jgi:hypothetical protein
MLVQISESHYVASMKGAILKVMAAILTACSTGVVPAGPDTYMISVTEGPRLTNGGAAKARTYREAGNGGQCATA